MAHSEQDYTGILQGLLPQGAAWPREPDATLTRLLSAFAAGLLAADRRMEDLTVESDPRAARALLTDYERMLGLPDPCLHLSDTLQERRADVVGRLTWTGGQSRAYFIEIAALIGYRDITIAEYRPFICGIGRCGDSLDGPHTNRFFWRVAVPGARVTWFRAGASQAGERLGEIDRASDLECLLQRYKPAHTTLIFSYEGV